MGRRHKMLGRRQILQLEDKKPPPVPNSKGESLALIQYSDSDEEAPGELEQPSALSVSEGPSSSTVESPLDVQVANFLKEIDALPFVKKKTDHVSSEAELKLDDKEDTKTLTKSVSAPAENKKKAKDEGSSNEAPASSLGSSTSITGLSNMHTSWQHCCDPSTGYTYYWNTETNAVTWECPKEYSEYLKRFPSHSNIYASAVQSPSPSNRKYNKIMKKKKPATKYQEGDIIPISSFGEASSGSLSDEEFNVAQNFQARHKRKKLIKTSSVKRKGAKNFTSSKTKVVIADTIGPQLPPGFQFQAEVESDSQLSSCIDGIPMDEDIGIGPQLPPDSNVLNCEVSEKVNKSGDTSEVCEIDTNSSISAAIAELPDEDKVHEKSLKSQKCELADAEVFQKDVPDSTTKIENAFPKSAKETVDNATSLDKLSIVAYDSDSTTEEGGSQFNDNEKIILDQQETIDESKEAVLITNEFERNIVSKAEKKNLFQLPSSSKASKNYISKNTANFHEEVSNSELVTLNSESSQNTEINSKSQHTPRLSDEEYEKILNNLFTSAHKDDQKFGFGFNRQQQLELENAAFSDHDTVLKKQSRKNYSRINFVKSKEKFNLKSASEPSTSSVNSTSESGCSPVIKTDDDKSLAIAGCSKHADELLVENNMIIAEKLECNAGPLNVELEKEKKDLSELKNDVNQTDTNSDKASEANITMDKILSKADILKLKGKKLARKKKIESEVQIKKAEKELEVNGDIDYIDELLNETLQKKLSSDSQKKSPEISTSKIESKLENSGATESKIRKKLAKQKKEEEDADFQNFVELADLSILLMNKLTFLIENTSSVTSLTNLAVQTQTRIVDWQAGKLNAAYFKDRLEEVNNYLKAYEKAIVSGHWSCQWDRQNNRYFYVNYKTRQSQWSFPIEFMQNEALWTSQMNTSPVHGTASTYQQSLAQFPHVSSSISDDQKNMKESFNSDQLSHHSSPPPPPPGVESPVHLPSTSPPKSPLLHPPDSTDLDGKEIPGIDMDIDNSDSSDSILFVNHQALQSTKPTQVSFGNPSFECSSTGSPDHSLHTSMNIVSSTSVIHSDHNILAKSQKPVVGMVPGSIHYVVNPVSWPSPYLMPSCSSSQNYYPTPPLMCNVLPISSPSTSSVNLESSNMSNASTTVSAVPGSSSSSKTSDSSTSAQTAGKKLKKIKLQSGFALKMKNMPSLVEKWQKIKKDQVKAHKVRKPKENT